MLPLTHPQTTCMRTSALPVDSPLARCRQHEAGPSHCMHCAPGLSQGPAGGPCVLL